MEGLKNFREKLLSKEFILNEYNLKIAFPGFPVTSSRKDQDGPTFTSFKIGDCFMVGDPDLNNKHVIVVFSKEIKNKYGISVGMSYYDILDNMTDVPDVELYRIKNIENHYYNSVYFRWGNVFYHLDDKWNITRTTISRAFFIG